MLDGSQHSTLNTQHTSTFAIFYIAHPNSTQCCALKMVLCFLCVKAELESVASMRIKPGTNLCLSVKNPLNDFETREKVTIDTSEFLEQEENSREPAHHFRLKWEGSKKYSTITVLSEAEVKATLKKLKKKKKVEFTGKVDQNDTFQSIAAFECRGIQPYEFHILGDEFVVESEGGKIFEEDVDLSEGDWGDYDEENDLAVGVNDFEAKFLSP